MRIKLISGILLFVSIILIGTGWALYESYRRTVIEGTEIRLDSWTKNIIVEIAKNPTDFRRNPGNFLFSSSGSEFAASSVLVQFMDVNGHVLVKNPALQENELPFKKGEDGVIRDIEFKDGTRIKTLQSRILINRKMLGHVIVGITTTGMYHNFEKLGRILVVVLFCALIVLGSGLSALVSFNMIGNQKMFLSFASHELRTPLAIISGHAEIALRGGHTQDEYRTTLQMIHHESEKMNRLVNNLLFAFRSQSGAETLHLSTCHVSDLVAEAASRVKKQYPDRNIILNLDSESGVIADKGRLMQVLENLLENAAKHTQKQGKIWVELTHSDKWLKISVRDNGIGIEPGLQKKIFDPFYRVDRHATPGIGLGLAISKWIVKAHGGKIMVKSTLKEGATFTVLIPKLQTRSS